MANILVGSWGLVRPASAPSPAFGEGESGDRVRTSQALSTELVRSCKADAIHRTQRTKEPMGRNQLTALKVRR
jgi:hypothetical protein